MPQEEKKGGSDDGYVFGNTSVYCPWDVVSYLSALLYDKNTEPKNYWRNTSSNGIAFFQKSAMIKKL